MNAMQPTSARASLLRYLAAGLLAFCATTGMFMGMRSLVSMTEAQLAKDGPRRMIGFVRLQREEVPIQKPPPMPERKEVAPPPSAPSVAGVTSDVSASLPSVSTQGLSSQALPSTGPVALNATPTVGTTVTDTDAVPLVRVPPEYPERAASQNLEGWVMVRFSIGKAGEVKNPTVVDASPPKIFNTAAVRSVSQWRYEPKVHKGQPVERHGLVVKINFALDQ